MGLTNFPNGISSFGIPVLGSGNLVTTGNVFFVDSGAANASDSAKGTDKGKPLATLDAAVGLCTANNGDIIVLMPGHAESVTTAAAIALDVAGVRIVGLGQGATRPTFTFTTSTLADIDIDAASVSIENCVFVNGIDSLAVAIDVNAADFDINDCEFRDSSTQTLIYIFASSAASRFTAAGLKARQLTAGAASFIKFNGTADTRIENCDIVGDYSVANISNTSLVATDILIQYNNMDNLNAVDVNIDLVATTDGTIKGNTLRLATSTETTWIDSSDCQLYENYGVNVDARTGKLIGTVTT